MNTIVLESLEYPIRLKQIRHAPKKLYYIGNPDILKNKFLLAVVGTRLLTSYGKKVVKDLLPDVARNKIVIVSGLAKGIDVLAHQVALEYECPTVAVLAGGLDDIYPPEHKIIAHEIVNKGGLLISEHSAGTQYLRQHFPARNRIISGLSDAVLVVEAKQKSGALITANFAFAQKKTVFAVPGNIFSPQSQGTNKLFEKGAMPATKSEDIIKFFFPGQNRRKRSKMAAVSSPIKELNLSDDEQLILNHISNINPTPINIIIRKTKFPSAKVIAWVTQLEIRGLIESDNCKRYLRLV
jgi:DNA processing protein